MGCTSSQPRNPSPDARKTPGPSKPSLTQTDSNKSKDGTGRFSTDREGSIRSGTSWVKDNLGFKAHLAKVNIFSQLERKYELGTLLGEGITGQVRLCTSKIDKHIYAIKSLNVGKMDDSQVAELRAEIEMLKHLDHPNVVALMEIFESENNICLIMEYCGGGDLSERRFKTEHDLASVVHQLLRAIAHCHHFKIIHRDLKLENIMFTSKNSDDIRLIDFGLSKMFFQQANQQANESSLGITYERLNDKLRVMKTVCGTVCYMAPEVLNRSYTEKADIWAVGVIAFTLITGGPPFNGADDVETLRLVKKGEVNYNEHVWKRLSPNALEFVKALLTYDADNRPSAAEALSLPWMAQFRQKREKERPIDAEFARKAWSALLRFTTYPLLKKAAFMIIAFHATEAEKKKLQDIFTYLDTDYVGELKSHHLKRLMDEFGTAEDKLTDEQFEEVFNNLDQSRTGGIHHLEFVSATIETVIRASAKLIDQAFDHLDANSTGFISADNLYDLLGDRYTMDDAKCILDQGFGSLELPPEKEVSRTLFFQMMEKCGLPSPFSSGTPSKTPAKPPMRFAEVSDEALMSSRSLDSDVDSKKEIEFKNDFAESKSLSSRDDQDSARLKEDFPESKSREDLFESQANEEEPIEQQPHFEASDMSGPLESISE